MMEYWHNLQAREQRTLLIGTLLAIPLLIYSLIIEPVSQELRRLEQAVEANGELLAWMEHSAAQVKALQRQGRTKRNGGSLLSLVDASAKQNGLGEALKQLKPDGGNGVRLRFEQAGFDDMLRWLGRLGAEQGVAVSSLTMERLEQPGRVNATVVLERGA